jgi:hypothetical protein
MPTIAKKLIVTAASTLQLKYGRQFNKVKALLQQLKTSDRKKGLDTMIVYIDDAASCKQAGIAVTKFIKPRECKQAIDALYNKHMPDYIAIVGAQDVFPFQELNNLAVADDEEEMVPSDLPYACDAPYSKSIKSFTGPTRVVGRIPDVPGVGDLPYFTTVINNIIKSKPIAASNYDGYFAVSTFAWRKSTQLSLQSICGNHAHLLLSPTSSKYTTTQLQPLLHFYNCHGDHFDTQFYGEKAKSQPVAIESNQLSGKIRFGTIVAAECCYGAELAPPAFLLTPQHLSIANNYFKHNAIAFVGASNIAYGPEDGQGLADLITQYFLKNVKDGASCGRALLQARQRFLSENGPTLDPFELKTIAQFYLLGDPSLLPVKGETGPKVVASNTVQNTRKKLREDGLDLKLKLAPCEKQKRTTASSDPAELNKLLRQTGLQNYTRKAEYKSIMKRKRSTATGMKRAQRDATATFRTFAQTTPTSKGVKFDNIKVLVVKEDNEQILGWRVYVRR